MKNASKTYWDIHPDDVEDLADYMEIDLDTEKTLLWVARMAACVELPRDGLKMDPIVM